ncbi:flagellar motor protein MotB [Elioraea tepidiphila]|jgi:chemotaxis protein MotB|uniref:flagellar motor protein MotB n=1 Tax=Elioraea tepidiphila TaxID=457934 RepID=UPI0003692C55|nr:flagellar motor protein MotB [Elioraea tepidiphila]
MSARKGKNEKDGATLVIRREEGAEHGHHGGAWKVAYADFVTAMMAFFLLMWLLNATTEEQKLGIAQYFAPVNVFGSDNSGSGKPFGGTDIVSDNSAVGRAGTPTVPQVERSYPPDEDRPDEGEPHQAIFAEGGAFQNRFDTGGRFVAPRTAGAGGEDATEGVFEPERELAARAAAEAEALEQAAETIRAAVTEDPALAGLARQLAIDVTPEGLRLQLLDAEGLSMFALGSSQPNEAARALIAKIAPVITRLGKPITIAGHTDATPFRSGSGVTNWELSADRANAARRLLVDAGVPEARIHGVSGRADRDLLLPADPRAAANRRIAILVQRAAAPPATPAMN